MGVYVYFSVYSSVYSDQNHVKERHEETISLGVLVIIRVYFFFLFNKKYMYMDEGMDSLLHLVDLSLVMP